MRLVLIAGAGSFFGGMLRYLMSTFITAKAPGTFPFGTFVVNLIGCFAIGCLFGVAEKLALRVEWRVFFITGILGGFTTFSAFSAETHYLLKTGHFSVAITYVLLSIVAGISLTFLGAWMFKFFPSAS